MKILVSDVVFRDDLYPRIKTNPDVVQRYASALEHLPPIEVNQRYELIDGSTARPGYDPSYASLGAVSAWAQIPFDEGLERTVRWYVDHPEWLQ